MKDAVSPLRAMGLAWGQLIWMQAGSSSGPETQLNINPHLTLSISPITINHCSAHRPPRQHQCGDCYLSGFPFYSTISIKSPFEHKAWMDLFRFHHPLCGSVSINKLRKDHRSNDKYCYRSCGVMNMSVCAQWTISHLRMTAEHG